MTANLYQPIKGEIVDVIEESPTIKSFVIVPDGAFKFDTGQFVELTLPGEGEAPFTPSSSPAVSEQMEITIMKAGRVTAQFHACQKGQPVAIRGPYGKGYPIEDFLGKLLEIVDAPHGHDGVDPMVRTYDQWLIFTPTSIFPHFSLSSHVGEGGLDVC